MTVRLNNAQQIADLLGKDVLIRALVEFIRISAAAKIQPLPGACIFISELPEIQGFDAIWTLIVTGLDGEELLDVTHAIQSVLGGSIQANRVTIVSFASQDLIRQVESYKQKQQIQQTLNQVTQKAQSIKDGRDGSRGPRGERGEPGAPGRRGPAGRDGRDGRNGRDIEATQTELFDLKDVEQGIAQEKGQVLTWDGTKWTNLFVRQLVSSSYGGVMLPEGDFDNQPLTWDGEDWSPGYSVQLSTTYEGDVIQGQIAWESDEHTAVIGLNGIHAHIAQDTYAWCRNGTANTITKGMAVMFLGTLGASGRVLVAPMIADGTYPGYVFLGLAAEDIASGEDGNIISYGKLKGYNTSLLPEQAILWCDPVVPGGLTVTEPVAPNLKLPIAAVVSSKNNGTLMVRWSTGNRLQDLHDVEINGARQDGDTLVWVAENQRWESQAPVIAEAPQDGNYYVRQNGEWINLTSALTALNVAWS